MSTFETVLRICRCFESALCFHLAMRMRDFHALGYVHRDLKPGNVMWLPRENRWTVIDFGCAARTGAGKAGIQLLLRGA